MSLSSAEGPMGLRGEQRTAPLDEYQYMQESIVYSLYLMLHTYREEYKLSMADGNGCAVAG